MNPGLAAETFDVHADRISTYYLRCLAMVEVGLGPGLWWLPPLLSPDPALVAAYRYNQIAFGVAGALTLAVLPIRSLSLNGRFWLSVANVALMSGGLGVACGRAPLPNDIPFHTIPWGFLMIAWSLRQRAISMTAAVVAFVTGATITATVGAWEQQLLNVYLYYACTAFFALLMGNLLYGVVHENWRQRRELSDRATALEQLNRAKTELVANVSHELRTPLTLILAALAELRPLAPQVAERGLRNAGRLTVLVDDMLELARFEAGHGVLERRRGDLGRLVREVVRSFEPLPDGGVLVTRLPEQPLLLSGDPRQLRTAVFNLVSNAIKFTDARSRRIEVVLEETEQAAVLTVRDNGAGVPRDALPRIFDRFYQADATETRRHGGVGIGLAVTHEIVTLHGGKIAVESELGVGSSFRVELPREVGPAALDDSESFAELEGARRWGAAAILSATATEQAEPHGSGDTRPLVLIAEDDADLRAYLVQLVSRDHRVVVAHDGSEAERLFDELVPDLVVADLMMPAKTGADLLRHVRAAGRVPWVPVLILTARTEVEVRLQVFDAGADDYLAKPFDERELVARIRLLLKLAEQERRLNDRNLELTLRVAERTEQLRRLASHQDANREEERRRLARELHDELGQILTGIRMELGALQRGAGAPEQVVGERVDALLDQAFLATRNLVYDLRPRVLDDLGLVPAVESWLERFRDRSSLQVVLEVSLTRETSPAVATTLFRALQESLTNVVRHARATLVNVTLADEGERLVLAVADNGAGFDVERVSSGFGLLGLRERALAAGGTLAIESSSARGTRVVFSVPWAAAAAREPGASAPTDEGRAA